MQHDPAEVIGQPERQNLIHVLAAAGRTWANVQPWCVAQQMLPEGGGMGDLTWPAYERLCKALARPANQKPQGAPK